MLILVMSLVQCPSDDLADGSGAAGVWDVLCAMAVWIFALASEPLDMPVVVSTEMLTIAAEGHIAVRIVGSRSL